MLTQDNNTYVGNSQDLDPNEVEALLAFNTNLMEQSLPQEEQIEGEQMATEGQEMGQEMGMDQQANQQALDEQIAMKVEEAVNSRMAQLEEKISNALTDEEEQT